MWETLTVCHGVEIQSPGQGEGHSHLRTGHEAVGGGVGVVTTGEVPVVARHDGVLLSLLHVLSVPLTDARTTSVSEDNT